MSKTLPPVEFVKPEALEDFIFEGAFNWGPSNTAKEHNIESKPADFFTKFNSRFGNNNNVVQTNSIETANKIKAALTDYIATQLPNIRIPSSSWSLGDFVAKNKGDVVETIHKPELKPWFHMLCAHIKGWLEAEKKRETNIDSLLQPFGGNITQLADALAPTITSKIQANFYGPK